MATFNRSAFKTSKSLAQQEQELASKIPSSSKGSTDKIEIEEGENYIRFYPVHPGVDSYFILPRMVHFLDIEGPKWEDGEMIKDSDDKPVMEVKKRTVYNSRIHGGTKKDVVDEYVNFVQKLADETYGSDKKKKKEYMKHVNGYNEKGKFVGGIKGTLDYVGYAGTINKDTLKETKFGLISLKKSVREGMLAKSNTESADEGIQTDPFTDPDDGFVTLITKDSKAGATDPGKYYSVDFYTKNWVPVKCPLPEGFELKYEELKPLTELFEGIYTAKMFEKAMDGLQRFDAEHGYGVFEYDEFLDICEEISSYYPEEGEEEKKPEPSKAADKKPAVKQQAPAKVERPQEDEEEDEEEEGDTDNGADGLPWQKGGKPSTDEKKEEKKEESTLSAEEKMEKLRSRINKN